MYCSSDAALSPASSQDISESSPLPVGAEMTAARQTPPVSVLQSMQSPVRNSPMSFYQPASSAESLSSSLWVNRSEPAVFASTAAHGVLAQQSSVGAFSSQREGSAGSGVGNIGYFSAGAESAKLIQRQQRPLQDIMSAVQGNFHFLQESQIELEGSAAVMAVMIICLEETEPCLIKHSDSICS